MALVSLSTTMKYRSQAVLNTTKHTTIGVLVIVSVIEDCVFMSQVPYCHRGFPRFFIFAALIVITLFPVLFLLVVTSTSHLISTLLSGIFIVWSSPSLSLPIYEP